MPSLFKQNGNKKMISSYLFLPHFTAKTRFLSQLCNNEIYGHKCLSKLQKALSKQGPT